MGVIGFAGKARRRGGGECARSGGGAGSEAHVANKRGAPGLVDALAELRLHGFELGPPGLGVGEDFEDAVAAGGGARVARKRRAHNRGPGRTKPGERRFGTPEAPRDAAEKVGCAFHVMGGL